MRSDYLISPGQLSGRARRIVSEDSSRGLLSESLLRKAFPADCPHRTRCHCLGLRRVAPDTRSFQHIAEFYNYLGQLIVTAAVYRGLASVLRQAEAWLTPPRNLPAPGRRQPLYVVLRLSRDLCFW